jgi:hypothetical protein
MGVICKHHQIMQAGNGSNLSICGRDRFSFRTLLSANFAKLDRSRFVERENDEVGSECSQLYKIICSTLTDISPIIEFT